MPKLTTIPMTFKLKPATKGDIDFLVNLRKQTMSEHLDVAGWFMDDTGHLERVLINFEDCYLIETDQETIGMVKYLNHPDKIFVMQLQILAKYQRQGMGRKVVEYLIELARDDSKHVELHVLKANPAKLLYERLGFAVYDEDKLEFHMTTQQ
ncbi:GNAT family N-acetyltransferase [uncultured Paraglaciecola sp.]|uniref:GNAT family N-acetyltransferase n=1 Tax=uncultured Paraglaciecola sp. TaxID=1765024 RepID=UPI0030D7C3D8